MRLVRLTFGVLLLAAMTLALPVQALGPRGTGAGGDAASGPVDLVTLFEDDFDGNALGPEWNSDPHTGQAVVANGRVTTDCATFCPRVWTKPILPQVHPAVGPLERVPPVAPFRVTYEFQYLAFTPFGVGLGASAFQVWQDFALGGMQLHLFDRNVVVPADLQPHVVDFVWTGRQHDVYLDGALRLSHAATPELKSHFLWIGNLDECCPNGPYNEISVDSVKVALIAPV